MFHCTRRASKKVKEKVDFSIHFHATQVHTAWDKLAVSLVSLESGRVTGKTRKAPVRNGQCHWPDPVSETAKLILDMKTHLYDEKLYKFVVAKGFSRACILGEVIINITDYVTAASPTSLSLPLRFCYAGTLLHIKIQCLAPKCINKPFSLFHGNASDSDTEIRSACGTPLHPSKGSPAHYLCRAYSAGSRSPVASTSTTGEFNRVLPPSPTPRPEKKSGMISISYISLSSPARSTTPPPPPPSKIDQAESIDSWKSIAEKLQTDLAAQRQELANLKMDADTDRSSYLAERDILQSEIEELKIRNDELAKRSDCSQHARKIEELNEELIVEKDSNTGLSIQLQKLRKANTDLLLVVRDLEDSLEEHTRDTERLLKCKVYNNPCAETDGIVEGEERFSEYSFETTDKNIDRIIDLNRSNDHRNADEESSRLKLFISAVSEDLSNMRVVLDELNRNTQVGDCYASAKEQLLVDLKSLVQGSRVLIDELQKTGSSEAIRDESEELEALKAKNRELIAEKEKIEILLNKYQDQEGSRQTKMEQLESQLIEFGRELEEMQRSNEQLESLLGAAKMEKHRLEQLVKDVNGENKVDCEKPESLSRKLTELENEVRRLEVDRENYLLERCVAENLARDLCKRVKSIATGSQSESDENLDLICNMKELRRSFSLLIARTSRRSESEIGAVEAPKDESVGDELPQSRNDTVVLDPDEDAIRLREELEKKALELDQLDQKVVELTAEKFKVDSMLKNYMDQVEAREVRMDQLEAKLLEFAQELDHMQESNDQLESVLESTKAEKQQLEILLRDANSASARDLEDSGVLLRRLTELEESLKNLEDEKDAYILDRNVAEDLTRDLIDQLQAYAEESDDHDRDLEQQGFVSRLKLIKTSLSSVLEKGQRSEDQLQEIKLVIDSLENKLLKNNEKAVANIAFLDEQFGQLSKESDRRIVNCSQEIESIVAKIQAEQEEKRSQGFLRVALEENVCEIAYLRDELRRVKEETLTMTREREGFKTEIRSLEAESIQWQSTLEELQEQFEILKDAGRTKASTTEDAFDALVAENKSLEEVLERKATEHCVEKSDLQRKIAEMQQKLDRAAGSTEQEVYAEVEGLKAELESSRTALTELRTTFDCRLTELRRENGELTEQKDAAEVAVSNLETELQQCKTLIASLKEEIIDSEQKLQAACDQRQGIANKCVLLKGELKDLRHQLAECSSFAREVLILKESTEDMVRGFELQWESVHRDFQAKESRIFEKLKTLEAEHEQAKISFDAVASELEQCKILNSGLEQSLRVQSDSKNRAEQESLHLKNHVDDMESKLFELCKEREEDSRLQQIEAQKLQKIIAELKDDVTKENRGVAVCTQTEIESEMLATRNENKESQDMRHARRKWKQQNDEELLAKIASLEAELTSNSLCLSSTIEKSQEREATLCEKIVHLEVAKRTLEDESINRREAAIFEIEESKLARTKLEESIARLRSEIESYKIQLADKESEQARLMKQHEELKAAIAELKAKHTTATAEAAAPDLESLRTEFQEKEALLWKKIDYLEMANEQLAGQQVDSGAEQLKKEVTRLQNHNSELTRREHELTSRLSAYELLQLELQRLQEENEQLEQKFLKLKDASLWGDTLERLVYLETELAEALETNNMYKLQLQSLCSVFSKNIPGTAAQGLSEVEGIIANLVSFKKQTSFLEAELKEMQERYLGMSMRYAEIQSEKEELVMTVKALKSAR